MPYWTCGSGYIELAISRPDARSASHSGPCDDDVAELSRKPYIKRQLEACDAEKLVKTLSEYGAWDAEELADHDQNLQRILWLACGDIADGQV